MTATVNETEVLPEGYTQEHWEDLVEAINGLSVEDAIVAALSLALLGFSVKGPDEGMKTPYDALIDLARTNPADVAAACLMAALQGLDVF